MNISVRVVWIIALLGWLFAACGLAAWWRLREDFLRLAQRHTQKNGIDPLTGLSLRDRFLEDAAVAVNRAQRNGQPLSVILVGIEDMHGINQRHGHLGGDLVLKQLAEMCRENLRDFDIVGRFSSEEVALVLVDTAESGAQIVANRLLTRSSAHTVALPDGQQFEFGVGVGISQLHDERETAEDLLLGADADLALRRAARKPGSARVINGTPPAPAALA
ncbi:GGDEF domain-containing protein [Amantichitinum ursilacus]|uniref:diguanylate cyclase n=1 Tax=Amantichitinum ursilacus TaxID=857265 RepID=A0A0N0XHC3_9NEIS|nr:GGDEF domain-containing protein [Amantichitinum ursilacus]KPC49372.1 Response regulator PleD [Amantichitinum ursilacus]